MRRNFKPRRAATTVEFAIIAPVVLLVLIGMLVGGMGIFRYQQLAHLAREASRWASVHGADYAKNTGNTAATAADVYNTIIAPNASAMNLGRLSYSVTWDTDNRPYRTVVSNNQVVRVNNTVTVSITYNWIPEYYLRGVILGASSCTPMAY
jgi:Flp pilus assembly protein TadG